MPRIPIATRPAAAVCSALALTALAGCGTAVSTSKFKGEQHAAAQTVANFQSDVSAGEDKKICTEILAAALVSRLGGAHACEAAIKQQREEVDNPQLEVESVQVSGSTAVAHVTSTHNGKTVKGAVALVKESGGWRISGLQ